MQGNERWRLRWNKELFDIYKDLNLVVDIKIKRLRWAVHVITMEEGRVQRKVLNEKFYDTRPVRAPKARWEDAVQRDTREMLGARGWRRQAIHREEWRHLLKEAKTPVVL